MLIAVVAAYVNYLSPTSSSSKNRQNFILSSLTALLIFSAYYFNDRNSNLEEAMKAREGVLSSSSPLPVEFNVLEKMTLLVGNTTTGMTNVRHPIGFADGESLSVKKLDNQIAVSLKIYNYKGQQIAELVDNEWVINSDRSIVWDRNYTKNALEIVNNKHDVIFQIVVLKNVVKIQTKLYDKFGNLYVLYENEKGSGSISIGGKEDEYKIKPIFKYPSKEYFGEFIDEKLAMKLPEGFIP